MSAPVRTATTPGGCRGRRGVDLANAGMRMRRAHEHAMQLAGAMNVADEAAVPVRKRAILDPPDRRADAVIASR